MSLENEERNSAYEKLTPQRKQLVDKVMENLEKGNLFWSQGWVSSGAPESAVTGKKYRGINNLFLALIAMSENYEDNRWATFKQMEEKGWTFKKDEEGKSAAKGKGATVEYYEMRDKETKKRFDRSVLDGMTASEQQEYMDKNVYWLRKFYRVFNCSLMDGVPAKEKPQIDINDRNERVEAILSYWDQNESKIVYGGSQAYYKASSDEVHLPKRADFKSMQEFYSTALHEIGHSTGHESRLNRDLSGRFGSEGYAMEELRAEIASIFMEQDLEIEPSEGRLQNNVAYIQSWKEEIKENPNALFTAITDADKIAKYVSERERAYRRVNDVQYYAIIEETNAYSEQVYFGHENVLRFDNRPFETVEEMDDELIKRWNDKVGKGDLVYVLGDLIWKTATNEAVQIIKRLNGQIILIKGNHDRFLHNAAAKKALAGIKDYDDICVTLEDGTARRCILSHYFIPFYNGHRYNAIHLHGHSHFTAEATEEFLIAKTLNEKGYDLQIYNVGCMYWNYAPVTLDEILKIKEQRIDRE